MDALGHYIARDRAAGIEAVLCRRCLDRSPCRQAVVLSNRNGAYVMLTHQFRDQRRRHQHAIGGAQAPGRPAGLQYPYVLREVEAPDPDEDGDPVTTMVVHWQPASPDAAPPTRSRRCLGSIGEVTYLRLTSPDAGDAED